jgi:hypothetical protein
MDCVRFNLQIAAEEYLKYYSGQARSVSVIGDDGRRIEFPAKHLREFVTADGIQGYFELCFDEYKRLKQLKRL